VTSEYVRGTGLPDVTIEIYSDPAEEGALFQGETTTDASGDFTWNGTISGPFKNITALAIDAEGNTSMFSNAYTLADLPPVLLINQYPGFFDPIPEGQQSMREASVSGENLVNSIVLKAPEGFKLALGSEQDPEFKDSLIIMLQNHNIEPTIIRVLFKPLEAKQYIDSIEVKSEGANSVYIRLEALCFGPPEISAIEDQGFCEGEEIPEVPFTFEFFSPDEVELTGMSGNEDFVPNGNITFTGEGHNRLVKVLPAGQSYFGEAEIMVILTGLFELKDTTRFMFTVHENPTIQSLDITPESTGNDGKIVVNAMAATETLQYAIDNGPLQQSNEFTSLSQGQYLITVSDNFACIDTATAEVNKITAVPEVGDYHLEIYPNPAGTVFTLKNQHILQSGYSAEIINLYGETILAGELFSEEIVAVGALSEGVYLLRIRSGAKVYIGKLIIDR